MDEERTPIRVEHYSPDPPAHVIQHANERHAEEMKLLRQKQRDYRLKRDVAVAIVSAGVGALITFLATLF